MNLYKKLAGYAFPLLCLVIFTLRLPPVFPFLVHSDLLSSHSIARYILFALFLYALSGSATGRLRMKIGTPFAITLTAFFISQSLSVIDAVNITAFLGRYKTILSGLMMFAVGLTAIDSRRKIQTVLWVLAASMILNLAIETVIYFEIPTLFEGFKSLVNQSYLTDLTVNVERGRYFVSSFDAALIPILFYLFFQTKKPPVRVGLALLAVLTVVFSLLSNFRTQLLIALGMIGASAVLFVRRYLKTVFLLAGMAFLFLTMYQILVNAGNYNSLDRLISPDELDYVTISDRVHYWQKSVDFGLSHPVFGIGLGNFYDYLTEVKPVRNSISDPKNLLMKITWVHPHNVFFGLFAETGFFGLLSFVVLLSFFAVKDYRILFFSSDRLGKALALSFWGLFGFSLMNPATTLDYAALFWIIRAMIAVL